MASGSLLHDVNGHPASGAAASANGLVPAREGLVVLTRDEALVHTVQAIGSEYDISTVASESDLAAHLLAENTGVAILDAGAIATPVERLSERLRAQFPELVLIVAGGVDDQSALATQITNGTVYRFLHKPVSEQRVKLFVDAAWRRHSEENTGSAAAASPTPPARDERDSRPNFLLYGGALAAVALVGWFVWKKTETHAPQTSAAATSETSAAPAPRDATLESLLARADKALAGGALLAPQGSSAVDYYRQAQQRNPHDPRGANGLEKVIDRLLSSAESQLSAQHIDAAQRLAEQARAIKPDHVRVAFLLAQIGKERERAVLAQARQAASSGNIEQALSVLDNAARTGQRSTLVSEAREELEQKEIDERVHDFLNSANDAMRRGDLLEPAQNNAEFFVESARALAPNDAEVKQARRQFLDRLVGEAHKALVAGNADDADRWIKAAADAGSSVGEIDGLREQARNVRAAAKTDALARLAMLVNQRLQQGKMLDPTGDNAKSYLAQLVQADPNHPSTVSAREAFQARMLEEARNAARHQDYAGAQRWLGEARDAGVDQANINAVNIEIKAAQDAAAQVAAAAAAAAAKKADDVLTGPALELTRYVPPEFPSAARARSMSGWVDVQFVVKTDGSVSDPIVVGAQPVGVFEQSAVDAVRKWHYRPIAQDGQPINQRARVRVRFALEK